MEEIKVGEYIRTIDGYIRKIDNINTDKRKITYSGKYILDIPYKNSQSIAREKIVKYSKNIIDLIDESDYVNDCKVYENHKTYLIVYQKVENSEVDYNYINHNEIKSIVTHEQFNQVKYEV